MFEAHAFDTAAHRLLDELDARHDQLLQELDVLNARVDAVLSQFTQVTPRGASAAPVTNDPATAQSDQPLSDKPECDSLECDSVACAGTDCDCQAADEVDE